MSGFSYLTWKQYSNLYSENVSQLRRWVDSWHIDGLDEILLDGKRGMLGREVLGKRETRLLRERQMTRLNRGRTRIITTQKVAEGSQRME